MTTTPEARAELRLTTDEWRAMFWENGVHKGSCIEFGPLALRILDERDAANERAEKYRVEVATIVEAGLFIAASQGNKSLLNICTQLKALAAGGETK
jgi:hypothetical protein